MDYDISKIEIIFYDGDCGLCSRFVQFIIKYDKKGRFFYSPLGSEVAKTFISTQTSDTVVLLDKGSEFIRSDAALIILRKLVFPVSLLYIFKAIPKPIRDYVYKLIANNRYRFFKGEEQCLFPSEEVRKRFI